MSTKEKACAKCVICGSSKDVEQHHAGGRRHVAWFTVPLCRPHHEKFHALLRIAGVNLEYTSDSSERLIRALMATMVLGWMLLEALLLHIRKGDKND